MMNLLNFPYNLQEMLQDEIQTPATDTDSPHSEWIGKEQPNTTNEPKVKNPPNPSAKRKTAPKSKKISA